MPAPLEHSWTGSAADPGDEGFLFEWPLWGLRLERPPGLGNRLYVFDSMVYQPTWAEWAESERSTIVREAAWGQDVSEAIGQSTPPPPLAVLARLAPAEESDDVTPSDATWAEHHAVSRHVVAGLRLYASGDFVDPEETCTYVSHDPSGIVTRAPRPLRAAFYDATFANPYRLGPTDLERLLPLIGSAGVVLSGPPHTNAALALENFCLSFGSIASPGERGLHCFIALEALLGPVAGPGAGSFHRRAVHAAHAVDGAEQWLRRAPSVRNQLAHSLHSYRPVPEDLATLEEITRAVIVAYLTFISRTTTAHPLAGFEAALDDGPVNLDHATERS